VLNYPWPSLASLGQASLKTHLTRRAKNVESASTSIVVHHPPPSNSTSPTSLTGQQRDFDMAPSILGKRTRSGTDFGEIILSGTVETS
jgi:hypothetical protein